MARREFTDRHPRSRDGDFAGVIAYNVEDKVPSPRGFVEVVVRDLKDRIVDRIDLGENLVVNLARRVMRTVTPGAVPDSTPADPTIVLYDPTHPSFPFATITSPGQIYLTKMAWGQGGHELLNPTIAIPPELTDEQLADPLVDPPFKLAVVDYTDVERTRYTATLEASEANGIPISEVGLFTNEHLLLIARKTFGILTKSSDFKFEFRYTLIY